MISAPDSYLLETRYRLLLTSNARPRTSDQFSTNGTNSGEALEHVTIRATISGPKLLIDASECRTMASPHPQSIHAISSRLRHFDIQFFRSEILIVDGQRASQTTNVRTEAFLPLVSLPYPFEIDLETSFLALFIRFIDSIHSLSPYRSCVAALEAETLEYRRSISSLYEFCNKTVFTPPSIPVTSQHFVQVRRTSLTSPSSSATP
jgi:hypothetical protein